MQLILRLFMVSIFGIAFAQDMQCSCNENVLESNGVAYKKDNFGNILPMVQGIEKPELTQKLQGFVTGLQQQEKGKAFIIDLPHQDGHYVEDIKNAGFEYFHGDAKKTQWIIKNGSPIPAPSTAIAGARVIVKRYNDDTGYDEILVIEDKHFPGRIMFPGGSVDPQELAIDAACRELKEEVNLLVKPEYLQLIGLMNRVKANRYGYSDYSHYFLTSLSKTQGDIKPQESEILRTLWVPLKAITLCSSVNDLKIDPVTGKIAEHIVNNKQTTTMILPDYRQMFKEQKDLRDTMTLHLFQIHP